MKILVTSYGSDIHAMNFVKHLEKTFDIEYRHIKFLISERDYIRDFDVLWTWGYFGDAFHFMKIAKNIHPSLKVVVTWVGSDILQFARRIRETPICRDCMLKPVDVHTTTWSDLLMELHAMSIDAKLVYALPEKILKLAKWDYTKPVIATYCPSPERMDYYQIPLVIQLAKEFPDTTFKIYSLKKWKIDKAPENVEFSGYVTGEKKLQAIREAKGYLTLIPHGGLGVFALEFMYAGRYVISVRKFPHVIYVKTWDDLKDAVKDVLGKDNANVEASKYYRNEYSVRRLRQQVKEVLSELY